MGRRTERFADLDSGSRFHAPNGETNDEPDPDRIYEQEMEKRAEKAHE